MNIDNTQANDYLKSDEAVKFRDEMIDRFDDMAHTGVVSKPPLDEFLKAMQLDAWVRGNAALRSSIEEAIRLINEQPSIDKLTAISILAGFR